MKINWNLIYKWICIITLLIFCIAFGMFSFIALMKHYSPQGAWEASKVIFGFLGVLLTAAAVLPVISSIFSYQNYKDSLTQANTGLLFLLEKQKDLEMRLLTLKQSLEYEPLLLRYLKNEGISTEEFDFVRTELAHQERLMLLQEAARYKRERADWQRSYDDEPTMEKLEKLIALYLQEIQVYQKLSKYFMDFNRVYKSTLFACIIYVTTLKDPDIRQSKLLSEAIKEFKKLFEQIHYAQLQLFPNGEHAKQCLERWFNVSNEKT